MQRLSVFMSCTRHSQFLCKFRQLKFGIGFSIVCFFLWLIFSLQISYMYITYKDHIHPCYLLFLSAVLLILCLLPLSLLPIFMFVCVDVCRGPVKVAIMSKKNFCWYLLLAWTLIEKSQWRLKLFFISFLFPMNYNNDNNKFYLHCYHLNTNLAFSWFDLIILITTLCNKYCYLYKCASMYTITINISGHATTIDFGYLNFPKPIHLNSV